jgi:hypothetical protein
MAKKATAAPAETIPAAEAPGTDVALASPEVRAEQALRFNQTRAHLDLLAGKFVTLKSVDTDDNFAAAKAAHGELRGARVKLEKTGKEARADATAYGKAVISVERKLIDIIAPEETRLAGLITAEQRRRDDIERAAREAAEARVRAMNAAFDRIRSLPDLAQRATTDEAITALQAEAEKLLGDHAHLPAEFHSAAVYECRIAINGCKAAQDALIKRRQDEKELEELRAWRAQQEATAAANAAEVARAAAVVAEQSKAGTGYQAQVEAGEANSAAELDDDDLPPGLDAPAPAVGHRPGVAFVEAVRAPAEAVRTPVSQVAVSVSSASLVPVAYVIPLLQASKAALRLLAQGGYATNPVYLDLAAAIDEAEAPPVSR